MTDEFTTRGGRGWLVGVPPPRKAVTMSLDVRDEPHKIEVRATLDPAEARRLSAALLKAADHAEK